MFFLVLLLLIIYKLINVIRFEGMGEYYEMSVKVERRRWKIEGGEWRVKDFFFLI